MFISIFIMCISIWVYSWMFYILFVCLQNVKWSRPFEIQAFFFTSFYPFSCFFLFFTCSWLYCAHASETFALLVCLYSSDIQLFPLSIHYEMIWFAGCRVSSGILWHLWCLQYPGNPRKPITCSPRSSVAVGWLTAQTGPSSSVCLEETRFCFQSNWGEGKRRDPVGHRQFHSYSISSFVLLSDHTSSSSKMKYDN